MKKLIAILLIVVALTLSLFLCSCNEQIIDLNYKFTCAHLVSANKCIRIKKWANYEDGDMVQIVTMDGSIILGHSNEIILVEGVCPYCGG